MDWAQGHGLPVLGLRDEVDRIDCEAVAVVGVRAGGAVGCWCRLGGDGTMLRTHAPGARARTPVLGVNIGRLGFLAEVDLPDLPAALSAIDNHEFTIESAGQPCTALLGRRDGRVQRRRAGAGPGDGVAAVEVLGRGRSRSSATPRTP